MRDIKLNPVRAAKVEWPEDDRWTSVHTYLGNTQAPLLTLHPNLNALGADRTRRADADCMWLYAPLAPDELARIRTSMSRKRPWVIHVFS